MLGRSIVLFIILLALTIINSSLATDPPTPNPTPDPTQVPTFTPSLSPTVNPTRIPTHAPTTTANPTFKPSLSPTISPTAIPIEYAKSSLVMGIGAGTLTIIVLAVALAFVYCLSEACERNEKTGSRLIATALFAVVFLALVFAPRENEIIDATTTVTDTNSDLYDSSIVPRVAIAIVTVAFAAMASCVLCMDLRDHHNLSNMTYDERAFWQD